MKKTIIKGIILAAVFLIGVYFLTMIRGKEEVDQITTMADPTLPIVYVTSFEEDLNELHGYTEQMQANYMRDTVTPLAEDRVLPITIRNDGMKIQSLSYEVRSLDTKRLVEQTQVTDYKEESDQIKAVLNIKNLLEEGKEYILIITVGTKSDESISYYTRIVKSNHYYVREKLDFIKEFNQKSFDKEAAKDLVRYLEPNSAGDNNGFHKVNINSRFEKVTWGELNIKQATTPIPQIKEIDKQTTSVVLKYVVEIQTEDKTSEYYNITEYYRVRYTQDRNYLLDFDRTMNQIFDEDHVTYKENRLTLGIRDENVAFKENSSGDMVAFVQEGELYCINRKDNKLISLYTFKGSVLDPRENYDQYGIKILQVDDEGNISFLVYGYMTRGSHEGRVGIDVLTYNTNSNVLEENIFIPSTKPYQLIKESVDRFVYRNNQNKMYLDMDNTIYSVNLLEKNYQEVVGQISPEGYVISKDNSMIAWQNSEDVTDSTNITIMNLVNEQKDSVMVEDDERVLPIGFMDDDFIYGVAKIEDITTDATGTTLFPMYCIRIQDNQGELIEEYREDGIYIVDAQIDNNVIKLTRATLDGSEYSYVSGDSIMNSLESVEGKTKVNSIVTQEKQVQIQLLFADALNGTEFTLIHPKQVLVEEDITLQLKEAKEQESKYYVYAKGELQGIYRSIGEAVSEADSLYGVVVDDDQEYIWERGNRLVRTTIQGINPIKDERGNSLAACLDSILELEGTNVDSASLMERGENAASILRQHIGGQVVEFSNASLSVALYYVSEGSPVIAKTTDQTRVLIVGYDELNISVMNPETGKIYKMGMNDSTQMFEEAGGVFITYMKEK